MAKRPLYTTIIPDEAEESAAEGSPEYRHVDGSDPLMLQTTQTPPIYRMVSQPIAETGLIPVLNVMGESAESDAGQDAAPPDAEMQVARLKAQPVDEAVGSAEKLSGKVLIIEDFPEVADVITVILRRMGFTTVHESHGVRAFERFNQMIPDIVLLDLALPDITGWKVLDAIKERQRAARGNMPLVIVMTAYGDPANRLVGKLQGVTAYLIKPFTAEELQRVVREAYQRHS